MTKILNISRIGYGRSCCDIHGAFLRTPDNDICKVKYVVEADPARAAAAKEHLGCETMSDYRELFAHKVELDFVTNASYSDLHYPITKDLLEHGFNVLCEKPLCKTAEMVQDLIDTAKANNVIFTIFHQYKFNDYFIQMNASCMKLTFEATKDIRDKYVLSRLAWDLGVLDELEEKLN
jgi:predicted dehydrogenase